MSIQSEAEDREDDQGHISVELHLGFVGFFFQVYVEWKHNQRAFIKWNTFVMFISIVAPFVTGELEKVDLYGVYVIR